MNWYKVLKRSTIVLSIFYIGILCAQVTAPECEACPVCEEPTNIWYKISTDNLTYGNKIRLDMSKGKSFSDGMYNYIMVQDLDTKEIVYIAFPNGGDWVAFSKQDSIYLEMEEDINDLQKYLDSKKSQVIRKKH
tara:strand:- start:2055 stop:2456 length:402 start_codon:yes stop_codon:yes gene_type:complete